MYLIRLAIITKNKRTQAHRLRSVHFCKLEDAGNNELSRSSRHHRYLRIDTNFLGVLKFALPIAQRDAT